MDRLEQIRRRREVILEIATRHGAENVRIFGSVARRDAKEPSNLDLLVNFEPGRSLLDLIGFQQDVEEYLGCKVDVVTEGGISQYLEARIMQEAVPL